MNNFKIGTTVGGNLVYHKGNLKEVVANGNSGLLSATDKQNINNIYTVGNTVDINITTQTRFDEIFCSGAVLSNTSIFLKRKDTPYILNNAITLGSDVKIISDGAIVNRGISTAKFSTTYLATCTASGTKGNAYITATSSVEASSFIAGKSFIFNGNVYHSTGISGSTIYTFPPILETSSNISVYLCTENIYTEGWTFDGQNGVILGSGNLATTSYGGAFYLSCCINSIFKAIIRNCSTSEAGGAYYGVNNFFNVIENIYSCSSSSGGGCHGCLFSIISNINYCIATSYGGGVNSCAYSTISNIQNCKVTSGNGGGVNSCAYSIITNINYCTASYGGGVNFCNYSIITNINYCTASYGGGVANCNGSTISNIFCNTASSIGGGYYQDSGYNLYQGSFHGCTAPSYDFIRETNSPAAGYGSLCRAVAGTSWLNTPTSIAYTRANVSWDA